MVGGAAGFGPSLDSDRLLKIAVPVDQFNDRSLPFGPVGLGQNPVPPAVQIELAGHSLVAIPLWSQGLG